MIVIQNEDIVVALNELLGGEISQVSYGEIKLLASYDWASPVGRSRSSTYGSEKLDWLSDYRGGWQLLIPNAGAACEVNGTPLPFHGEWSRTQVEVVEHTSDRVVMTSGTRLPLTVTREVQVVSTPPRVLISTSVHNATDESANFIWGEHPAFTVENGDAIDLPTANLANSDGTPIGLWPRHMNGGRLDLVTTEHPYEAVHYLTDLPNGWAALRRSKIGIALAWDAADFPHAWVWHEIGSSGFPFYGRASLVAIEPSSSWPGTGLATAIERGQAFELSPDERKSTTVALIPFPPTSRPLTGASVSGHLTFGDTQ